MLEPQTQQHTALTLFLGFKAAVYKAFIQRLSSNEPNQTQYNPNSMKRLIHDYESIKKYLSYISKEVIEKISKAIVHGENITSIISNEQALKITKIFDTIFQQNVFPKTWKKYKDQLSQFLLDPDKSKKDLKKTADKSKKDLKKTADSSKLGNTLNEQNSETHDLDLQFDSNQSQIEHTDYQYTIEELWEDRNQEYWMQIVIERLGRECEINMNSQPDTQSQLQMNMHLMEDHEDIGHFDEELEILNQSSEQLINMRSGDDHEELIQ